MTGQLVLLIIWVLALLGDIPMQSELACHAGLNARCFCRICMVRGRDGRSKDTTADNAGNTGHSNLSHGRQPHESPDASISRVRRFIQVCFSSSTDSISILMFESRGVKPRAQSALAAFQKRRGETF